LLRQFIDKLKKYGLTAVKARQSRPQQGNGGEFPMQGD